MNYSTAVFLINDDVRSVEVGYDPNSPSNSKIFKTLDQDLKTGDYVVVPTDSRHNMTVGKVLDVDVEFDLDLPDKVMWIIDTVDKASFDALLEQEATAVSTMRKAKFRTERSKLKAELFKDREESLKELELATPTPALPKRSKRPSGPGSSM